MGVMLSATDSLNWLARIVGKQPSELTEVLGEQLREPGPVRFYPYLSGERTPHNNSEIRGGFTGSSTSTSQADMTRAVLEGVAFGLRDSFDALAATDSNLEKIIAIEGGSASTYWTRGDNLVATFWRIWSNTWSSSPWYDRLDGHRAQKRHFATKYPFRNHA